MTTAAAAAEYKSNTGHDFMLADAYDAEYLEEVPALEPHTRRDEEAAPLMSVRRPKGKRVGPFLI